ncbi:MAG TPA: glycosyltransferase [Patescibacteria group bacterium]|nr:glycosyltransferase [Patescibacteria group bacterium]
MKLSIGFITYNKASLKYLAEFLPSLKKALSFLSSSEYQVMVYDNSDEQKNENRLALEFFDYKYQLKIEYYSGEENIGFGAAYNVLINKAKKTEAKYFLIINPDTLLESDSISKLVSVLDKDDSVDAVSPKVLRWDHKNSKTTKQIDTCGLILKPGIQFKDLGQGKIDKGQYDDREIIAPSGAVGLFKMSSLQKISKQGQYFDPDFFMYKEDCDLAYRFKQAKMESKLVSESVIYHDRTTAFYGGGFLSFIRNRSEQNKQVKMWSFKNQHLLYIKYFTKESFFSQMFIIIRVFEYFILALILEQYNLKLYKNLLKKISID